MTVMQFLDYLASYEQTRDLALQLHEIIDEREAAFLRRTA
jgi:hypothetical protein